MTPLPIHDAARALGIPPGTLRKWVRNGCPVARQGSRGRGNSVLVDLAAVRAWRDAADDHMRDRLLLELASELPQVLAAAAENALREAEGVPKDKAAELLAMSWYIGAAAIRDHLRTRCPAVQELTAPFPPEIERLRKINRG